MQSIFLKRAVTTIIVVVVIGLVVFALFGFFKARETTPVVEEIAEIKPKIEVIGQSVEGRKIESYTFGTGETEVLFVGGIHGGYEWNSSLLAYEFIDYIVSNPDLVPENLSVSIVPVANPDGLYDILGKEGRFSLIEAPKTKDQSGLGRFNANNVDLNRNFDCKWKPESTWRSKIVSAGTAPFSEPEARAIRDFVLNREPVTVVFWHSQANAVYASECEEGILPATRELMNAYSIASGYPAIDSFDHYEINGDAEGWLASIGIPAITVELKTHETIEWSKNLAGFRAVLDFVNTINY